MFRGLYYNYVLVVNTFWYFIQYDRAALNREDTLAYLLGLAPHEVQKSHLRSMTISKNPSLYHAIINLNYVVSFTVISSLSNFQNLLFLYWHLVVL
jgi:hypothetical protein